MDIAAQGGFIAEDILDRCKNDLGKYRLKPHCLDKVGRARGIGGQAQICGVVEISLGLADICGMEEN